MSYAPVIPLVPSGGYELIKAPKQLVLQNFNMLLLTNPGERMMMPEFGVGLRNYLFEMNHSTTYSQIETQIRSQTSKYLPYIDILSVDFKNDALDDDSNLLNIGIILNIRPLGQMIKFLFSPSSTGRGVVTAASIVSSRRSP